MLEGRGQALRAARLGVLAKGLSALPSSLPVHLELASLADPQFMVDIADGVRETLHAVAKLRSVE